jgi:hypothetical protein
MSFEDESFIVKRKVYIGIFPGQVLSTWKNGVSNVSQIKQYDV